MCSFWYILPEVSWLIMNILLTNQRNILLLNVTWNEIGCLTGDIGKNH